MIVQTYVQNGKNACEFSGNREVDTHHPVPGFGEHFRQAIQKFRAFCILSHSFPSRTGGVLGILSTNWPHEQTQGHATQSALVRLKIQLEGELDNAGVDRCRRDHSKSGRRDVGVRRCKLWRIKSIEEFCAEFDVAILT